jgi:hypothetical protein
MAGWRWRLIRTIPGCGCCTVSFAFSSPPHVLSFPFTFTYLLEVVYKGFDANLWVSGHIAWHIAEGLGVQFLENPEAISFPEKEQYDRQCANWKAYQKGMPYVKVDSGL